LPSSGLVAGHAESACERSRLVSPRSRAGPKSTVF